MAARRSSSESAFCAQHAVGEVGKLPGLGVTHTHRRLEQRERTTLQRRVMVCVLTRQPCGFGAVGSDQTSPRPAAPRQHILDPRGVLLIDLAYPETHVLVATDAVRGCAPRGLTTRRLVGFRPVASSSASVGSSGAPIKPIVGGCHGRPPCPVQPCAGGRRVPSSPDAPGLSEAVTATRPPCAIVGVMTTVVSASASTVPSQGAEVPTQWLFGGISPSQSTLPRRWLLEADPAAGGGDRIRGAHHGRNLDPEVRAPCTADIRFDTVYVHVAAPPSRRRLSGASPSDRCPFRPLREWSASRPVTP